MLFKIESWNFQHWSLWNLSKFQLIQLIQTIVIFIFSIGCLIELNFWEVSRNSFQTDSESFSNFYLEKQKSFIPKKKFLSSCQYQNKKLCLSTQFFVKVLVEIYNIITGFGLELHCIVSSRDLEVSKWDFSRSFYAIIHPPFLP